MSERDDGGPAFAREFSEQNVGSVHCIKHGAQTGMSLRDWFAGQALVGVTMGMSLEPTNAKAIIEAAKQNGLHPSEQLARICLDYADAMLAERRKP